jgi:hypothetical protein
VLEGPFPRYIPYMYKRKITAFLHIHRGQKTNFLAVQSFCGRVEEDGVEDAGDMTIFWLKKSGAPGLVDAYCPLIIAYTTYKKLNWRPFLEAASHFCGNSNHFSLVMLNNGYCLHHLPERPGLRKGEQQLKKVQKSTGERSAGKWGRPRARSEQPDTDAPRIHGLGYATLPGIRVSAKYPCQAPGSISPHVVTQMIPQPSSAQGGRPAKPDCSPNNSLRGR